MSKLIKNDEPVMIVSPKLAVLLGDADKAIILQQIDYWLEHSNNIRDGYKWVYNSVADWQKQFLWISPSTLTRKLKSLEDQGLLITGNYNKRKFDKTKWYRIDYDEFNKIEKAFSQNDQTIMSFWVNGVSQNDITNTREYTDNNTDIINSNKFDYNEFIEWFNKLADKDLKNTEINRQYIKDLLNDGYTKEDLVNVIEYKVNEWKDDDKMNKYLRFRTLLSPNNFKRYLQDAKESLPSEPQKKKEKSSAKREKRKDPIEELIYQNKLFLEKFPDNEKVRAELKRLEQIRDERKRIDDLIYRYKLFLSEHPDNENEVIKAELKRLEQIRDELNKIDEQIHRGKLFLEKFPDNEKIRKTTEQLEQQRQDMIEKAMILSE